MYLNQKSLINRVSSGSVSLIHGSYPLGPFNFKTMEIWKDIEGYKGIYQISNLGMVKSLDRVIHCPTYLSRVNEIIMKQGWSWGGYRSVNLLDGLIRKKHLIHRLVGIAFVENKHDKKQVNHIDGNKENNNSSNLEWCTHSENIQHAYNNKLIPCRKGENHPNAKLTNNDVLSIRKLKGLFKVVEIAEKYKVKRTVISKILNRRTWKHI